MKLIEGIKHQGAPFWIPDCTRSELPELFVQLGLKKGVEIGVSWGQNIVDYCRAGLEIYGIDPWKNSEDNIYRKIISIPGDKAKDIDTVYNYAVERTRQYPNCKLIRKLSMDALADFPKRSLDFVYIDGNHGFGYVAMDLMKWSDKIRKGGVIAGHDYLDIMGPRNFRSIRYVVNAYAQAYDYKNWYIIGKPPEGKYERHLSYLFFKHW